MNIKKVTKNKVNNTTTKSSLNSIDLTEDILKTISNLNEQLSSKIIEQENQKAKTQRSEKEKNKQNEKN